MNALILHRNPLEPFPYDRWLADHDGEVVLLAARDKIEAAGEEVPPGRLGSVRVELLDDFSDDEQVLARAHQLAVQYDVGHVVAHHEGDVDSAAALREQLGLTGPWTADVAPFRDKVLMKDRVLRAGIEVAPHTVPRTAHDVRAFVDSHGFRVVVKDRAGFNSIGLRILRDDDDLEQYLGGAYRARRDAPLIEAFVPGRMCHVDGLVVDGRTVLAWPSQYQYDLASYGGDPGARVDLTLAPDDPLTSRLLAVTEQVLAALRLPRGRMGDHAFHAEIFHTPDDRLVLCEIASRPGGAKVRDVLHTLFGVNVAEYATRAQLGLPTPGLQDSLHGGAAPTPRCMAGQVLMMKRPGLVRSLPTAPVDPWVEHFWVYARPGQVLPPAGGSSDFLVAAVASAPTRESCESRLRGLGARFETETEIEQVS